MHPKDADGMANSVDPDQTAPLGAVWSESTMFPQTCLSEKLRSENTVMFLYVPIPDLCGNQGYFLDFISHFMKHRYTFSQPF